jgi:hypothetical protein
LSTNPFGVAACLSIVALGPAPASAQIYESIGIRAQGMSGAFVAVADDATATWWNPAGLAAGGFFNVSLEFDRLEDSSRTRARGFAMTVPSLGLSYYRLSLNGMQAPSPTDPDVDGREDQGVLSQYGVTVGQSVGRHLVVATTLKLVRVLDDNEGGLDAGAMALLGPVRAGLTVRNVRTPEFSDGIRRVELVRQVRTGVSYQAGSPDRVEFVAAADSDLTTTPTAFGDVRHLAFGAEARLANRAIGVRGGVGMNTIGELRRSSSVGLSVALYSGLFGDIQLTRGDDESRNGWGFAFRVTL